MRKNHSRVLCEVCGERLRHGQSTTVGHGPNHVRRAVCNKPKCQREWKYNSAKYIARWPETKAQAIAASQASPTESNPMKQKRRYITPTGIAWLANKVWAPGTRRSKGWAAEIAREAKRLMPKDFPGELSSVLHRIAQLVENGAPAGLELRFDSDAQCEVVRRVGDHAEVKVVATAVASAEPAPEAATPAPAGELKFVADKVRAGFDDTIEEMLHARGRLTPRATALGNIIVSCVQFLQASGDTDTLKALASLASEKLTK